MCLSKGSSCFSQSNLKGVSHPPVKGGRFPHKVHLEVVGHLHRSANTASQLNSNLIAIIFKTLLSSNMYKKRQTLLKRALAPTSSQHVHLYLQHHSTKNTQLEDSCFTEIHGGHVYQRPLAMVIRKNLHIQKQQMSEYQC